MRKLHPEILFHFTTQTGLFGILESNFAVSYARECVVTKLDKREFAIPMVSFCDLRISELANHMSSYGQYGIGMKKSWANRRGLSPVWYVNADSSVADEIVLGLDTLFQHLIDLDDGVDYSNLASAYTRLLNLLRYIKSYEGELARRGAMPVPHYRFADEREWRYVPPVHTDRFPPFVKWDAAKTKEEKDQLNAKLGGLRLIFEPDDIQYLIVETDAEREALLSHIELAKRGFDELTRRRLASRILTAEQIFNDV